MYAISYADRRSHLDRIFPTELRPEGSIGHCQLAVDESKHRARRAVLLAPTTTSAPETTTEDELPRFVEVTDRLMAESHRGYVNAMPSPSKPSPYGAPDGMYDDDIVGHAMAAGALDDETSAPPGHFSARSMPSSAPGHAYPGGQAWSPSSNSENAWNGGSNPYTSGGPPPPRTR